MLKIGLTGGIGCGKSTTCDFFSQLGVPVIDADELAREVVSPGSSTLAKLTNEFGTDILFPDNSLNRAILRKRVFSNTESLNRLEAIVHPEIRKLLAHRLVQINAPYVIIAIPLLLEKNWQSSVDRILVIDCSTELQIERALKRDKDSADGIRRIIKRQIGRDERIRAADDVIHNDSDIPALRHQVEELHLYYTQLVSRQAT
jgi:dephospho-CoA kinase